MDRALERASNRLRNKLSADNRRLTASLPPRHVAAALGPVVVAAAGDLWEGAWKGLEKDFKSWGASAHRDAVEVVSKVAGGFTVDQRTSIKLRQAADLDEAWSWMADSLQAVGDEALFKPVPGVPDMLGELDPSVVVPPGLVRQAVARAGGLTEVIATDTIDVTGVGDAGHGAWVGVQPSGLPLGGIGTGPLLGGVLADAGVEVVGYRWVYGPALRKNPFEPHRKLDGLEFENFDDEQLANGSLTFPSFEYFFPGDHAGCVCDFEPWLFQRDAAPEPGRMPPGPLTDAEIAVAGEYLPELKELIARDAKRTIADSFRLLDQADALRIQRPPRGKKLGGEWDWLRNIDPNERDRLMRDRWSIKGHSPGASLDNVADRLRNVVPGIEDWSTDQIITDVWLPATRRIEAAGALASGRVPVASRFSGPMNLNDLAPTVHADGYDIGRILSGQSDGPAVHIAEVWRGEAQETAERMLGKAVTAVEGPAPWKMTTDSWADEVIDLEYQLDNFPGEAPSNARARLAELLPEDFDRPGFTLEEIHAQIVNSARVAGERVPHLGGG